jgi:DNA polymerase I-like protein with 3'-5' exonuclease and polymerase domains
LEILLECPQELAPEIAKKLQESMEKAGDVFCKVVKLKAVPMITKYWEH